MKILSNYKRITNFFWNRRSETLDFEFWQQVVRVVGSRFLHYFRKISDEDFEKNISVFKLYPPKINIEVVNICNANCIFCAYQYQERPYETMLFPRYKEIVDQYVCDAGGGDLYLEVVMGDPLVDKEFIEKIKYARSNKDIGKIHTITNGLLLDKVGVKRFLLSGITDVLVSLAILDESLYCQIYRVNSRQYDRVRKNIYNLLEVNCTLGYPVDITLGFRSSVSMKKTLSTEDYKPMRQFKHDVQVNTDFDTWLGEIKQDNLLPGMFLRPKSVLENEPCFMLYEGAVIYSNGKIGLCACRDYNASSELIVGDINNDRLIDVWRSEKVERIRDGFYRREYPEICTKCTTYEGLDKYRTRIGVEIRNDICKREIVNGK
jgi:MoaA/NifB/PqqE/SkfB family radical SAM enzyme